MKTQIVLVVLGVILISVESVPLPKYFSRCGRKDPDFEKCAIKSAKKALPSILEGDRSLNIPNMKPLKLPFLQLESSRNLELNFTDLEVFGLENTIPVGIKYDFDKQVLETVIEINEVTLKGPYHINGRILILPIKGDGTGTIKIVGGQYRYIFHYELFKKKDKNFAKITKDDMQYVVKGASFNFENLFNGDKRLGDEMNKFLNENWEQISNDFSPVIGKTVSSICRHIAENLLEKVPFDGIWAN